MVPDFLLHLVDGYLRRIPVDCACLCPNLVTKVHISFICGEICLTDDFTGDFSSMLGGHILFLSCRHTLLHCGEFSY